MLYKGHLVIIIKERWVALLVRFQFLGFLKLKYLPLPITIDNNIVTWCYFITNSNLVNVKLQFIAVVLNILTCCSTVIKT